MATKQDRQRRDVQYGTSSRRLDDQQGGFKPTAFIVPEGLPLFKFKKGGIYKIDIIPFIAGKGNRYCDPGLLYFEKTYWVHNKLGPKQESHCCLRENFGKPCPVCEYVAELVAEHGWKHELVTGLRDKERRLFLFSDRKDTENPLQLYECAHYMSFGALLDTKLNTMRMDEDLDEDEIDKWWHPNGGSTLKITAEESTWKNRTFYKPVDLSFVLRKEPLSQKLLKQAPCLDDLLAELSYKKLKELLYATPENAMDEDEEETPKKKGGKTKTKPQDEEEDEDEEEEEEEEEEDEDEEETPKSRSGKKSSTSGTKKRSSDEDDEEEDEDDVPNRRKRSEEDEDDDEEDDDSEEEDSEEDDEENDTPEDEEEPAEIKVGTKVEFTDDKGRDHTGEVVAVNKGENTCTVKDEKGKRHIGLDLDEVMFVESDEEEEEEEDEDEEESPKSRSSKGGKKSSKASDEDEEEEEEDEDEEEEDDDIAPGDIVSMVVKGKKVKGTVNKINRKKDTAEFHQEGKPKPVEVKLSALKFVSKPDDMDEDEDEDEDD